MLTKDDVVYYKTKLQKLFKDAKNNNIRVEIKNGTVKFFDDETREMAIVDN